MIKNSIQPLIIDEHGVLRFKSNKIVEYLLEHGGINLNDIACLNFSKNDREHFAQLIGYSHSGYGDLSYVSDETYNKAYSLYTNENDDEIKYLKEEIEKLKAIINRVSEIIN